jgi:hypothetical protein
MIEHAIFFQQIDHRLLFRSAVVLSSKITRTLLLLNDAGF